MKTWNRNRCSKNGCIEAICKIQNMNRFSKINGAPKKIEVHNIEKVKEAFLQRWFRWKSEVQNKNRYSCFSPQGDSTNKQNEFLYIRNDVDMQRDLRRETMILKRVFV